MWLQHRCCFLFSNGSNPTSQQIPAQCSRLRWKQLQIFTELSFIAYVFTDVTSQWCHIEMKSSPWPATVGPHSKKSAQPASLFMFSLDYIWKVSLLQLQEQSVSQSVHQSVSQRPLESDCLFSGLRSLWTWTGKLELFLKGKFRGWINLGAVWSVKWSCRAIFLKISFIRYELLYLRPILGRRLDETPRGPSFHSVIYIQVFDWKIAWQEFVAVELLSPFLCTHTYLNSLFHNVMMSFIIKC